MCSSLLQLQSKLSVLRTSDIANSSPGEKTWKDLASPQKILQDLTCIKILKELVKNLRNIFSLCRILGKILCFYEAISLLFTVKNCYKNLFYVTKFLSFGIRYISRDLLYYAVLFTVQSSIRIHTLHKEHFLQALSSSPATELSVLQQFLSTKI